MKQHFLACGLLGLVAILVVTVYAKSWGPLRLINSAVNSNSADNTLSESKSPAAPEFADGTWINSEALTVKRLRGRVVLIEFWTFGCYNCRNTLPFVKRWYERYGNKGLVLVGVHSPELEDEKDIENVRREVTSLGIRYPVVTDNNYSTWNAYHVEAWPTIFVLDKMGRIRWTHVGEGEDDETEQVIQKLLAEDNKQSGD
jgi:thiol-disulfide isomerase/thioredoxin